MPSKGAKYQPVSKTDHEIFMDELYNDPAKKKSEGEKTFDFTSINDYNSIFKYRSGNALLRQNGSAVDHGEPARLACSFSSFSYPTSLLSK